MYNYYTYSTGAMCSLLFICFFIYFYVCDYFAAAAYGSTETLGITWANTNFDAEGCVGRVFPYCTTKVTSDYTRCNKLIENMYILRYTYIVIIN